jgi:KDO2-lipid IV(A) lauroyltransferase
VTEAAAALNRSVESCIADCPEQYQWEYKRFKKQPDGAPRRYQF